MITFVLCTGRAQGIKSRQFNDTGTLCSSVLRMNFILRSKQRRNYKRDFRAMHPNRRLWRVCPCCQNKIPTQKRTQWPHFMPPNAADASCVLLVGVMHSISQGAWWSLLQLAIPENGAGGVRVPSTSFTGSPAEGNTADRAECCLLLKLSFAGWLW